MGLFDKLKASLTKTKNNFAYSVRADKISDEYFERVEEAMILSDAGYDVAMSVSEELRKAVRDNNAADEEAANVLLKKICSDRLRADRELDLTGDPAVIMLIGVNGSGKTTAAGKLAAFYKQQGRKVMIAAADTFRAAAAEQLEVWAQRSGTEFFSGQNDPSAVVFDAVRSAAAGRADLVICDTAGRLQTKKNLMDELGKIARTVRKAAPDASVETLLVLDGMTGQNAIEQARAFAETADVSGIIVTKLDGTAKGGSVFSVKEKLGIPVRFIGVGEGIDDLLVFDPDEFCEALFE
ncbi:MAG: signal recognition particle-docking protein FtsY [Oscillospiraceae bacterium]|jgi:fused signal recognition particle receptor|nr:signal recognition particle-docking protein FtsY [Oscillospiraceae bacterium]MBR5065328.1 signal recognition particle-docking protein FtsY [Oscillospiraceae bacterium]